MWPSLIGKAKEGGLDVIQTYVFWNLHEPQPGQVRTNQVYEISINPFLLSFRIAIYREMKYFTVRFQWKI